MWAACTGSVVIVDRQEMAEVLKENRTLKRLNLAHTGIGVRGVEAWCSDCVAGISQGIGPEKSNEVDFVQFAYSSSLGQRLCNHGGS